MQNTSLLTDAAFIAITFLTVGVFFFAAGRSRWVLYIAGTWMLIQLLVALFGFYKVQTMPPRFALMGLPPALFITALFLTACGRAFIDRLNVAKLTILHTVRIPVEIILYYLFVAKAIPEIMTFEGRNLDIIIGLTAPIVYYYGFVNKALPTSSLLLWNLIGVGLLFNIVVLAILSAPSPFQQLGFGQPNVTITYFPYVWLPSVVVPIVFFSHFVAIRQLLRARGSLSQVA